MGHYGYRLSRKGAPESFWRGGGVMNFPRKKLLAWDLLFRILRDAVEERNGKK